MTLKKEPNLAFLSEVSSVPLQQALRHQHQAFQAFFAKRARYPRFRSRGNRQAAHYTRSAFRLRDGELRLAKTTAPLRFVWSWPEVNVTALNPATVIVCREPDGRWYVTFAIDTDAPEPLEKAGHAVGVDLGVTDFAVTSDGDKIANPRHFDRKARGLARYQRRLARCRKGSANRAKAVAEVARAHRKVRCARQDFLHKASTRLVRSADTIVIEDLNVAGLVRNRPLARAISDCGWGEFRRQLAYKCTRYGRRLVVIDRWYPSSKTCSACGYLLAELSLGHQALDVPVLRHPARPGHQRREEHPGGRSCRVCLRSWRKTSGDTSGAAGGETGTPADDGWNPYPAGRGVALVPLHRHRRTGDQLFACIMHNNAGVHALRVGDIPAARAHLEAGGRSRAGDRGEQRQRGDQPGLGARQDGYDDAARSSFQAALRMSRRSGKRFDIAYAVLGLACLAEDAGEWSRACVLHGVAQAALDRTGEPWQEPEVRYRRESLAQVRTHLGQEQSERDYARGAWR